jgi:hypothetical protein
LGLFNGNQKETLKTLNVIYEMVQQRQKDIEFRSQIVERSAKIESDYKNMREKAERFNLEI